MSALSPSPSLPIGKMKTTLAITAVCLTLLLLALLHESRADARHQRDAEAREALAHWQELHR